MTLKRVILIFLALGLLSAVIIPYMCPCLLKDQEPPVIIDGWWGRGEVPTDPSKFAKDDARIQPFTIRVEDSVLQDLTKRLESTRWFEPLENVQFQYGFHQRYLKEVVNHWKTRYDWKKQERELNKYRQFTTQIEGISVHYIHVKPDVQDPKVRVIPLMMVHGWPGSVVEFYRIIPLLTTPRKGENFVFEVICPSIPGYGFSEAPHQPGFSAIDTARIFGKLMDRLGHKKFYVQGGDWGSFITSIMSMIYPDRVQGLHVNMVISSLGPLGTLKFLVSFIFPSLVLEPKDQSKLFPFIDKMKFLLRETGYMHIQATKPDTVGMALTDSPAGLAAYILEKFSTWTDPTSVNAPDGALTKKFPLDMLLNNVMVYWVTNSITSSLRFYKENMADEEQKLKRVPINVPSAVAAFPNELLVLPRTFMNYQMRNLVQYTDMPRGGHFAAMEEPQLLADDVWKFVKTVETTPVKER